VGDQVLFRDGVAPRGERGVGLPVTSNWPGTSASAVTVPLLVGVPSPQSMVAE
jgi:hypothetical protein